MRRRSFLTGLMAGAALAALAAPAVSATYDFTGANDTLLSTLGWTLLGGDDAFKLNGSGVLKKATSTAVRGLYVEGGAGASTQSIAADISTSATTYIGVLCTWNNGLEGYFLRRSSATSLRLMRYAGGLLQTNLVSAITVGSGTIELSAVVGASSVVLTVKENGAQVSTFTDATINRLTSGRIGLAYETTAAVASVVDNVVTASSGVASGTGVLQNTTLRFGRQTPALNGAIRAYKRSLGLLVSGAVASWQFDRVSGDAAKWPAQVATGYTPAPTANLTDADAGSQAVYSITIDGVLKAQTLTINVQSILEPIPSLSVASQFDINRLTKSALGGKAVEFMEGCSISGAAGDGNFGDAANQPAVFSGFKTHTGTLTVRCQPSATKGITCLQITDSQRMDVVDCLVQNALPAQGTTGGWDGVTSGWANTQNRALLAIDYTVGTCDSIRVQRCRVGAPLAAFADKTRWYSGIAVSGSTTVLANKHTNIVIGADASDPETWTPDYADLTNDIAPLANGNVVRRVKDGITGSNIRFVTERGNLIRDFCSNASFHGGKQLQDLTIWDCCCIDGWTNPADLADHPDLFQWGSTAAAANYERIDIRRIALLVVDCDKHSQGPFFNDVGFSSAGTGALIDGSSSQRLSGFVFTDCTLWNVYYNCGSSIGVVLDLGSGWDLRNLTVVRGKGVNLATAQVDPSIRGTAHTENVSGAVHQPTGTASRLAAHALILPGFTVSSSVVYNDTLGATGLSGPPGQNEAVRIAYYDGFFADPGGSDFIAQGYPLTAGALLLGDGSYAGCFNPDGTWATGAPFSVTPPTSYTMSTSTDTLETGTPATITITLNAPATQQVTVTVARAGVTGGFSPATVVIPVGQSFGTTAFTPTSAGTATLSASDDVGLTDPANIQIAVSDPTPTATAYAQALASSAIRLGRSVTVTYTLNALGSAPVTITPASTLAGAFAPATCVIPVGQLSGSVSFTPSAEGVASLTCSDNAGLTDPAAKLLTVTISPTTRGQLLKLLGRL